MSAFFAIGQYFHIACKISVFQKKSVNFLRRSQFVYKVRFCFAVSLREDTVKLRRTISILCSNNFMNGVFSQLHQKAILCVRICDVLRLGGNVGGNVEN